MEAAMEKDFHSSGDSRPEVSCGPEMRASEESIRMTSCMQDISREKNATVFFCLTPTL